MHPALSTLPAWADPWPGKAIIHDLPEELYHGTRSIISKSALDIFARTPLHYLHSLDAPPRVVTDEMKMGSAFHVRALEPDLFNRKVAVIPEDIACLAMQSSKNRALRDAWAMDEARGKIILKPDQFLHVDGMASAVRRHPAARKLLASGNAEVSALWTDPETGLRCKSRADFICQMRGVYVDLKSAVSAAPDAFQRSAVNMRYHVQDAFYSRAIEENGTNIEHFVFIVVEREPPYAVACYQLDETAKLKGESLYMRELRDLRDCMEANYWPGYGDRVMDLSLPAYATRDDNI